MDKDGLRKVEFWEMSFAEERAKMARFEGWFHGFIFGNDSGVSALIELENGHVTKTDNVTTIKFLDR
jgi:hypothetical protein